MEDGEEAMRCHSFPWRVQLVHMGFCLDQLLFWDSKDVPQKDEPNVTQGHPGEPALTLKKTVVLWYRNQGEKVRHSKIWFSP